MAKQTYKNETDKVFRFEQVGGPEKIVEPGDSAKLEPNPYIEGLVAQGYFSTKESTDAEDAKDSEPTKSK